jgi:hypothetical protein
MYVVHMGLYNFLVYLLWICRYCCGFKLAYIRSGLGSLNNSIALLSSHASLDNALF